ncbi:thermonuclease family protein [Sphingomonas donggukensis]|uniref:Thermonuclease family protein n=1 Tax=Sphingomonas donggukensis TaxID=2949093 RepID=A0ABY4TZV9_9SPHN|nr:thermonuclease family protein [Sphingomonas donggukensis]URW77097.1 thermonuclease family protein [Sphingomonas donggukensis]
MGSTAGAALGAPPLTGRVVWVTDGDTVRLESGERVRIADIDAPETRAGQAHCRAEIVRGARSTRIARALLDNRYVSIERVGISYGRTVARLRLNGADVATLLVSQDVARWWRRGKPKPIWCPTG